MIARQRRRTLQLCTEPGCPELTRATRCSAHATQADQPWRGKTGWTDLPADWPQIRARVLAEEPMCRRGCGRPSETVDHRIPRSQGGSDARVNLQGLCGVCHRIKTQREARTARGGVS